VALCIPNREGNYARKPGAFLIEGFHHDVQMICHLLGCYAASSGNSVPTFRDIQSGPASAVKKSKTGTSPLLLLENVTDNLYRNVGTELPPNLLNIPVYQIVRCHIREACDPFIYLHENFRVYNTLSRFYCCYYYYYYYYHHHRQGRRQ
jgi:hypothetical protein